MDAHDDGPVRLGGSVQPPATEDDWSTAAAAVLRKARRLAADAPDGQAWEALAGRTVEGLLIPPLGTPERAAPWGPPGYPVENDADALAARAQTGWDVRSLVADPDRATAAAAALDDLANGATSLVLAVGGSGTAPGDLAVVLDGVLTELAPVVIAPTGDVTDLVAAAAFADVLRTGGSTPHPACSLGADPVGRLLGARADTALAPADLAASVADVASLATDLGIRALVVDGTVAHRAGAGDAQELGYTLAVGAAYLRWLTAAGHPVGEALALLEFRYAATAEQFITIAKFRAARLLWQRVAQICGAASASGRQAVHAVTSWPMLTRYDPWVNLLRTTVAAFAAGVGGADAITVLPFDSRLGVPDALGRRMSRNISALLIAESHVAAVMDPAAGAHAVEILTGELAAAGWAEFQRIERVGGVLTAVADGSLLERHRRTAVERAARISTRRQPLTGVSEFPNPAEVLPRRRSRPATADPFGGRAAAAWSEPFEVLRDVPVNAPVFLAALGPVPDHAARAGLAANLFAAGGVPIVAGEVSKDEAALLAAFRDSGARVVCLAGSDRTYKERGVTVARELRAAGATRVLLAGRPTPELTELLDGQVAAGDDVLAFLAAVREFVSEAPVTA